MDLCHTLFVYYRFIALAPKAPAIADATAIITFRIVSQTDFLIAINYLLSVFYTHHRTQRGLEVYILP